MRFSQTDWKPRNMYKVFCFIAFGPGSFTFPAPGHFVFVFVIEFVWLSSRISFAKFVTMNITKSFNFNVNVLEGGEGFIRFSFGCETFDVFGSRVTDIF